MADIGDRIKVLRKSLKLSQTDFGATLGMGLGVIRNFESGLTVPSTAQCDLICKVYNINREWLLCGEGEMFRESTQDERIAQFVGKALADKSDRFKVELLDILAGMNEDDWKALKRIADILNGKKDGG